MGYKKILVAIDLSEEAEQVITAAEHQLEKNPGADLHLVHVVKPVSYTYGPMDMGGFGALADLDVQLKERARQVLLDWASKLGTTEANVHIRLGGPAHEVKLVSEEIGSDLIVMGTHGRHGLGLLLGSTATGVLHGAQCDVLTVRVR